MKVTLGTLKGKGDELAAFLEPRVGTKPSVSGDSMEIEDEGLRDGVKPRHVKTYIKRFLFMNGVRKKYRVFVSGKELTIQEIVLGEEPEEEKEKKASKEREAVEETPKAPEEPEPQEEEAKAPEPEKDEGSEEKPKKAAPKKPRAKKKKSEES